MTNCFGSYRNNTSNFFCRVIITQVIKNCINKLIYVNIHKIFECFPEFYLGSLLYLLLGDKLKQTE